MDFSNEKEAAIFRDGYRLLKHYSKFPSDDHVLDSYWSALCDDLVHLGALHDNHPLARRIGCAVFEYLEDKFKISRGGHTELQIQM